MPEIKLSSAQRRRDTAKPQFLELMIAIFDCVGNTRQQLANVRHNKRNSLGA
jgi:hypothetical protein